MQRWDGGLGIENPAPSLPQLSDLGRGCVPFLKPSSLTVTADENKDLRLALQGS